VTPGRGILWKRQADERIRSSERENNAGPVQDHSALAKAVRAYAAVAYAARQTGTNDDRTGGQRRIREKAGDTFPARAPAACIPKPVFR